MELRTHRHIQICDLHDRAESERVAYYCRAIKAVSIGNRGAAKYFTEMARKWEAIRIRCARRIPTLDSLTH